jgi:hypothetical protein
MILPGLFIGIPSQSDSSAKLYADHSVPESGGAGIVRKDVGQSALRTMPPASTSVTVWIEASQSMLVGDGSDDF